MTQLTADDVTIVEQPTIAVAILEHRGPPDTVGDTIRRFIDWRRAHGLPPARARTFAIFHDDPRTTPPAEYRLDLAVATTRVPAAGEDLRAGTIPGGRCARLRVTGASDDLEAAALVLYHDWLPASGEALRDDPLHAERLRFFPDVPEGEAVTDLLLPLRQRG